MATDCIAQVTFEFDPKRKPVVAVFDAEHASSDGGAILLKGIDTQFGLTKCLAACLEDPRQPGKVQHQTLELFRQRVFGLACGYADCNDAARLADDAIHKLLLDRDPIAGPALASQPTLSRFENAVGWAPVRDMAHVLADTVIETQRRRLKGRATRITIDLDPTDDPTHGQQEFTFFNRYYDCHCYLPVVCFLTFNDEAEQYLVASVLRPGNVSGSCGAIGILRRLLQRLDSAFPGVVFRVRLDGGFAAPEVLEFLDRQPRVEYVVNLASHAVLDRLVEPAMRTARRLSKKSGETEHVYGEFRYKTKKSWKYERRILYKAEVVRHPNRDPKDNPRFVVTNMKQSPPWLYEEVYRQRGDIENRIKELHYGMEIGRTSCTSFWANQFRVLMTAAAYVLMQELRLRLARTDCARAQVSTLRERFLKLGVQVVASVRRIVLHLPQAFPYCEHFYRLALSLGAQTG